MIGLYILGAAHGAPGFFDAGAENMPHRPIQNPGRHKADIVDYFGSGGCAVKAPPLLSETHQLKLKFMAGREF